VTEILSLQVFKSNVRTNSGTVVVRMGLNIVVMELKIVMMGLNVVVMGLNQYRRVTVMSK